MAARKALTEITQAIQDWATERRIPVSFGHLSGEETLASISFEGPDGVIPEVSAYLDALERLDAAIVLFDCPVLTSDDLDERLQEAKESEADPEELKELRALRSRVGEAGRLVVKALTRNPPVVLEFAEYAEWHDPVFSDDGSDGYDEELMDPETKAFYEARDRELELWTGPKRKTTVDALLADPRFPKAKTATSRVMLLRELLGEDAPQDGRIIEQVAREAKAKYDLGPMR